MPPKSNGVQTGIVTESSDGDQFRNATIKALEAFLFKETLTLSIIILQ
jgi:hypothetical protein